jgi:hypothetical protein
MADIAKVTSITAMGGNSFGLASPIITGYIVGITGSFDNAFFIAGALPLIGATSVLLMTPPANDPAGRSVRKSTSLRPASSDGSWRQGLATGSPFRSQRGNNDLDPLTCRRGLASHRPAGDRSVL